jgi:ribosomal protein S25
VKCGSTKSVGENFTVKFLKSQFKAQQASTNVIKKSPGSLLDKKPAKKCCVLTKEKLYKIGAMLQHTPLLSLGCPAQKASISKSLAAKAMKMLKLQLYRCTRRLVHALQPCDLDSRINFCNLVCNQFLDGKVDISYEM